MTENLPTAQPAPKPALRGGGNVMAIVPQTFEDTMRISRAVVMAGLAPAALVGNKLGDDAASAVAIAIMSGAELGLQPMVSLRSFTVINGKPALYGDGLINVVRQSGKVTYLRTGCEVRDGKMVGWCEAKRNDTDEEKRVEFSQDDAVRAGLWSDQAKVKKFKANGESYEKANDSPWYRYPQRMLAWRAAGFCLRELFGDVLGGIRDEFEAREIAEAEDMRDITPARMTPPTPPEPPEEAEVIDQTEEPVTDHAAFLLNIGETLSAAKNADEVEQFFDELDVQSILSGDEAALSQAFTIKNNYLDLVERTAQTLFDDLPEDTKQAVKLAGTP